MMFQLIRRISTSELINGFECKYIICVQQSTIIQLGARRRLGYVTLYLSCSQAYCISVLLFCMTRYQGVMNNWKLWTLRARLDVARSLLCSRYDLWLAGFNLDGGLSHLRSSSAAASSSSAAAGAGAHQSSSSAAAAVQHSSHAPHGPSLHVSASTAHLPSAQSHAFQPFHGQPEKHQQQSLQQPKDHPRFTHSAVSASKSP